MSMKIKAVVTTRPFVYKGERYDVGNILLRVTKEEALALERAGLVEVEYEAAPPPPPPKKPNEPK